MSAWRNGVSALRRFSLIPDKSVIALTERYRPAVLEKTKGSLPGELKGSMIIPFHRWRAADMAKVHLTNMDVVWVFVAYEASVS
jgi:hypothetical protein